MLIWHLFQAMQKDTATVNIWENISVSVAMETN